MRELAADSGTSPGVWIATVIADHLAADDASPRRKTMPAKASWQRVNGRWQLA